MSLREAVVMLREGEEGVAWKQSHSDADESVQNRIFLLRENRTA